jgi:hypothetical protein
MISDAVTLCIRNTTPVIVSICSNISAPVPNTVAAHWRQHQAYIYQATEALVRKKRNKIDKVLTRNCYLQIFQSHYADTALQQVSYKQLEHKPGGNACTFLAHRMVISL